MNTTKLKTVGAFVGTWLLRLAPFWVSVGLTVLILHIFSNSFVGFSEFIILLALSLGTFMYKLNNKLFDETDSIPVYVPLGFFGALVVSFFLLHSGVSVGPDDAFIHDGVVTKNTTGNPHTYGSWYEYTVVQNTHQDVSYEATHLDYDGTKKTIHVNLDYDVPAELILKHHANDTTPDYQEVFSDALERAGLQTVQETHPTNPRDTAQVILGHLKAQLNGLSSSVVALTVKLELDGTTMTHTSSNSQGMLSAEHPDES